MAAATRPLPPPAGVAAGQVMRQRICPTPARVWVLDLQAEMGSLLWAIFYHTDMEFVGTYK